MLGVWGLDRPPPLRNVIHLFFRYFQYTCIYYLSRNDLQLIMCNVIKWKPQTYVSKKCNITVYYRILVYGRISLKSSILFIYIIFQKRHKDESSSYILACQVSVTRKCFSLKKNNIPKWALHWWWLFWCESKDARELQYFFKIIYDIYDAVSDFFLQILIYLL